MKEKHSTKQASINKVFDQVKEDGVVIEYFNFNKMMNYFEAFGLNSAVSKQLTLLLQSWISNNGPSWTVSRLKDMKISYVNLMAGLEDPFKDIRFIAHTSGGKLSGPFRNIYKLNNQQALGVLMCYSQFIVDKHSKTTKSQNDKFISGLSSKRMSFKDLGLDMEQYIRSCNLIGRLSKGKFFSPVKSWISRDKSSPHQNNNGEVTSGKGTLSELIAQCSSPTISEFLENNVDHLPSDLYSVFAKSQIEPSGSYQDCNNYVGQVSFIQESGLKLRSVAIPFLAYQVALSRLGNSVYTKLSTITSDSTFNQDQAVVDVQRFMQDSGETLMSIDLSSATDTFPFSFTEKILSDLGADRSDLELFKAVSKGNWSTPLGDMGWTNGQPLGVYPSFGAFALSHHVLANMAQPKFYRILGDDIVIDHEAGVRLRELYSQLNLKISESKSITSSVLAEFGGRLILKDKVLIQPKWREPSDNNFLNLALTLGPNVKRILKPRQLKILKLVEEIPRDFCTYAMGWNPSGKSYNLRLEENKHVIELLSSDSLTTMISPDLHRAGLLQVAIETRVSLGILKGTVQSVEQSDTGSLIGNSCTSGFCFITEARSQESDLLLNLGVHSVDILEDCVEPFVNWRRRSSYLGGDPRGPTTLEILEKRFKLILKPVQKKALR